jgi:hypothetical protein
MGIVRHSGRAHVADLPIRRGDNVALIGLCVSSAVTERPYLDEEIYPAEPDNDWRGELDYRSVGCAAGGQRHQKGWMLHGSQA